MSENGFFILITDFFGQLTHKLIIEVRGWRIVQTLCDQRYLMIFTLLVATDKDKSIGGKAFHKQGILEK